MNLEPPDVHYLSAAIGWIGLGDFASAREEAKHISPSNRSHPDVLMVWCLLYAQRQQWKSCLRASTQLINNYPEKWEGWVNQSCALWYLGRQEESVQSLLNGQELFPTNSIIPYNLACYFCRLGMLEEAANSLETALDLCKEKGLKERAMNDPDLAALWDAMETV